MTLGTVVLIVVVVLIVGLVLWAVGAYNGLIKLRNLVQEAWRQIDVELTRRHDLIGNLVETVKGYAAHERGVFEEVTEARARAQAAQGVEAQSKAETALGAAFGRLFAVAEAYPDLKASASFTQLQSQLAEIEGDIAVSRQVYNDTVLTFRNAIESVPTNVLAGIFKFGPKQYFEIDELAAGEPVRVQF